MDIQASYSNLVERSSLVAKYQGQGYRMLHDDFDPEWKTGQEPFGTLTFTDEPAPVAPTPEPPRSTHISVIDAIDTAKARPVRVKRVWEGRDYFYDCLVTESVKDQYLAGDVAVGDYVIIHFDDIGELVVTAKVFKSW